MKRALITGVTGQDGSYLAEFLIQKEYEVYGMVRRSSNPNLDRVEHIKNRLKFVQGDLTDQSSLDEAIRTVKPDEVYNLAAQSFVPVSWNQPGLTGDVTGLGVARMLEAIRKNKPDAKFYQASSSEMFGKVQETPQTEKTPFYPRSPYGVAKVYGHWITVNYRESYNLFACSGILFNHESPRRGLEFVTRKVTRTAAKIKLGFATELRMGNLDSKRDWGYAGDYVEAMWMMLQQSNPSDFVIATGQTHTVRCLVEKSFGAAGIRLEWRGNGIDEKGVNAETGKVIVSIDPQFFRPAEVDLLIGSPAKAKAILNWVPKVSFESLLEMMVSSDIDSFRSPHPTIMKVPVSN